jgi:quercetin dioxygenase-like cupin family protein
MSTVAQADVLARLAEIDMVEAWEDADPTVRVRFGTLEDASTGTCASALFYLEVPPGHRTPRQTHTSEELVLVLSGEAEGFVGEERRSVGPGETVVIPAHAWHGFENVGTTTFKFLASFASAASVHEFEEPLMPMGTRIMVTPPTDPQ